MDNKKILVVEDDGAIREVYEEILKANGFIVDTAGDGLEGVEKAKNGGYSLILLDVMMPRMDGLGVLRELKAKYPNVKNGKILLLTNLSHDDIVQEGIGLGATSSLVKADLTPEELVKKVKENIS